MIHLKTSSEIEVMRQGGKILTDVLQLLMAHVEVGMTLLELDALAEKEILKRGAKPSFKLVPGYNWTICACINDVVVHGIPNDYVLKRGDVVGIDCGVYYKGFHTDSAWTVFLKDKGNKSEKSIDNFLKTGIKALENGIQKAKKGNYVYDISSALQKTVEDQGYSIVKTLVGHGVGKKLHEDPEVPGYVRGKRETTPELTEGLTLAIEVIYNMGKEEIEYKGNDGWTIATRDGTISGLFEATVAISSHGCLVLTPIKSSWTKSIGE